MTFDDYWKRLLEKNPKLGDGGKMTIGVESFKAQLRRAFDAGAAGGGKGARDAAKAFGEVGAEA